MVKIEIETLQNCTANCPYFRPIVKGAITSENGSINKVYKCENLEMCKVIERRIKQ